MGTTCTLVAVADDRERARDALGRAEAALRRVEALMSTWLADSEASRLNRARAGERVALSSETLAVLQTARQAASQTEGAFDITCGPVIELWREAGRRGRLPSQSEIEQARAASSWRSIELMEGGAAKLVDTVQVDLGGIAKGYGIDRAVEAMRAAGARGGLVDVGGDLRCFGQPPDGSVWTVDVRDPFGEGRLVELGLAGGGVCTSGSYARFVEIEGRRYSHIVDPRSGRPADAIPSVTVIAGTALDADVWATALSVLGAEGLARLPAQMEAVVVTGGTPDDRAIVCTPRAREMMRGPLPERLTVEGGPSR